jgi:DNA-binding CsgD family transcriptional regulator
LEADRNEAINRLKAKGISADIIAEVMKLTPEEKKKLKK